MTQLQSWIILFFGFLSFVVTVIGFYQSITKKNSFGDTSYLFWLGIFVWGDALVIAPFWFFASFVSFFQNNWLLFLLTISVFWLVRSLGETIYWLNQQFSPLIRNPPEKMPAHRLLKNDSIWFIYQIFWQCLTVISLITTIYLIKLI